MMLVQGLGRFPEAVSCYLSSENDPNCINVKDRLDHSLQLRDLSGETILIRDFSPVQHFLVAKYGGAKEDYQIVRIGKKKYDLFIPQRINMENAHLTLSIWGNVNQWQVMTYDSPEDTTKLQENYMVRIKIKKFPIECWYGRYVAQAVASFGTLAKFNPNNLPSVERSFLEADVQCEDLRKIPKYVEVKYNKRRKWCRVIVLGWVYNGPDQRDSPDTDAAALQTGGHADASPPIQVARMQTDEQRQASTLSNPMPVHEHPVMPRSSAILPGYSSR